MRLAGVCCLAACTGTTVTITTDASYVRYRAGSAAWQVPHPLPYGHYSFTADDEFEVVAVLDEPDFFATELFATVDDGDRWTLQFSTLDGASPTPSTAVPERTPGSCSPATAYPSAPVSGQMQQLGTIAIGALCASPPFMETTPWSFSLPVAPGTYDIVASDDEYATGAVPRIAITRGITIDGPTVLPPIDLDQQGTELDARRVTIGNAGPISAVTYGLDLFTAGATATILDRRSVPVEGNSATLYVVPKAILEAGDAQQLTVAIGEVGAASFAYSEDPTRDTVYDLLVAPGVTYAADGSASWADALSSRVQRVDVDLARTSTVRGADHVTATGRWLARRHASSLAFDASPPDFAPSWIVDPAAPSQRTFAVRATEGSISYLTYEMTSGP